MAKNALIVCNFRLRNRDEFDKIVTNFKSRKYDIVDIGEIEKDNFDIKILENKIAELQANTTKYDNISVISNIRDVLFIWYRIYNKYVDNFIFFIDKINYSILKKQENSDILTAISEFQGIEEEKLKGKIYINIDYLNYETLFEFLFKNFKFIYFENINNIEYIKKEEKEKSILEKKRYLYNSNKIEIGNGNNTKEINLNIDTEIEKENFYRFIDESKYFYPFYTIFVIKNYSADEARNIVLKCFEKYFFEKDKTKEKIAEIFLNTAGFWHLSFKEKIGILSINFGMEIKKHELSTTPILEEAIKDNGENARYYYYLLINLSLGGHYVDRNNYRKNWKKVSYMSNEYYKSKIGYDNNYNSKSKNILIVQDSLKTGNYSGTKLVLDIAKNIKKYMSDYNVVIYCEDNFFGNQDENFMILDYNNRVIESSTLYKKEHLEYLENDNIKVIYSHINKKKEDRIADLVNFSKAYEPEVIITTTVFSNGIDILYEMYPILYLSLGGINSFNKFDLYLFPHLRDLIKIMPDFNLNYNTEKMISFDYGGNFTPSVKKEELEKFAIEKDEFVMITVGVRLKLDLIQEYVDVIADFLEKKDKVKWMIVGELDTPTIDIKYKNMLNKKIIKVKHIDNLGEVYRSSDLYLNPPRIGGGFSMAEAVVNDLCVLTTAASPAGALHCGRENGVGNLKEYSKELEKLYKDKNYRNEKLKREQSVQESLSYKNLIPKLMEHIETAKKIYFERKGMKNE